MASLAWTSAEGAGPALSERGEDLGAISDSLARAGRGEGSVLLFEGSPGVGKTAMLGAAAARARAAGMAVLAACAWRAWPPPG